MPTATSSVPGAPGGTRRCGTSCPTWGYIDWEDRRYVPAALSPTGTGQAAKWRLSEALMEMLANEKLGLGTAVVVGEEETKADEAELGVVLLQEREGEEDLYCDKSFLIHEDIEDEPLPDWIIDLRQPEVHPARAGCGLRTVQDGGLTPRNRDNRPEPEDDRWFHAPVRDGGSGSENRGSPVFAPSRPPVYLRENVFERHDFDHGIEVDRPVDMRERLIGCREGSPTSTAASACSVAMRRTTSPVWPWKYRETTPANWPDRQQWMKPSVASVSPRYSPSATACSHLSRVVTWRISGIWAYPFSLAIGTTMASTTRM